MADVLLLEPFSLSLLCSRGYCSAGCSLLQKPLSLHFSSTFSSQRVFRVAPPGILSEDKSAVGRRNDKKEKESPPFLLFFLLLLLHAFQGKKTASS